MDNDLIKKKISEKNKAKKKYLEKLELLKQSYGVEFKIDSFKNDDINKIRFYNMNYQKSIKNVSMVYDNKYGKFNYLSYDYSVERDSKTLSNHKIIEDLNREKKLKLLVDEILKVNIEYKQELMEIDNKYSNSNLIFEEKGKELEFDRKEKKE